GHHHHLICRVCGATQEFDLEAIEVVTSKIAKKHGYQDVSHNLEVFGVCDRCQSSETKSTLKPKLR
ncbi:MAG: transcriptional repressor, partial [Acidobacteria bacterium]|nr:transcriptional repressor [Acidobacteriota bacterium]